MYPFSPKLRIAYVLPLNAYYTRTKLGFLDSLENQNMSTEKQCTRDDRYASPPLSKSSMPEFGAYSV